MPPERTVTTEAGVLTEGDGRFITVEALPHDLKNNVDHIRFSAKFQSDARLEIHSVAIQPFRDDITPHFHMGVQLEPEKLDDFITALEMIRHEYLGGIE